MDERRYQRFGCAGPVRVWGMLAALLLAAVLASPAWAAEEFGLVSAVDRSAGTMTIDGRPLAVDDETEFRDLEGAPMAFSAFPVPAELEVVAVYYEAEGDRLRSVRITELPR